jgi:hypothetical protein
MELFIFLGGLLNLIMWGRFYLSSGGKHEDYSPGVFSVFWLFSGLAMAFGGYVAMGVSA